VNQLGEVAIENIPTCGIVKINFKSSSWDALKNGQVEFQLFPKNLMP
jgi:phosphohistidine phosphatase